MRRSSCNGMKSPALRWAFCFATDVCRARATSGIVRAQAPGATCACWIGWVPAYRSRVSYAAARYGRTRSFEPENNPF